MLNRFKDTGGNEPLPEPVENLMSAWAEFFGQARRNNTRIHQALGTMTWMRLDGTVLSLEGFKEGAELQLADTSPELMLAVDGLRTSAEAVKGWQINWRNLVRGEVIGTKVSGNDKMQIHRTVRGPDEFEEDTAWVVDQEVGINPAIGTFGAWLCINYYPNEESGIYMPMDQMFEIELTPPAQSEIS